MPIKTGRVRRNYDKALKDKVICSNMLLMAIAALNYSINHKRYSGSFSKYIMQRRIITDLAINNGIDKENIQKQIDELSQERYPSDRQIDLLIDTISENVYSFNDGSIPYDAFIPDADMLKTGEREQLMLQEK